MPAYRSADDPVPKRKFRLDWKKLSLVATALLVAASLAVGGVAIYQKSVYGTRQAKVQSTLEKLRRDNPEMAFLQYNGADQMLNFNTEFENIKINSVELRRNGTQLWVKAYLSASESGLSPSVTVTVYDEKGQSLVAQTLQANLLTERDSEEPIAASDFLVIPAASEPTIMGIDGNNVDRKNSHPAERILSQPIPSSTPGSTRAPATDTLRGPRPSIDVEAGMVVAVNDWLEKNVAPRDRLVINIVTPVEPGPDCWFETVAYTIKDSDTSGKKRFTIRYDKVVNVVDAN